MNTPDKQPLKPVRLERIQIAGQRRPLLRAVVDEETTLMPYLQRALPDRSRTTIKQLLHDRFIAIGIEPTTQFDAPLKVGDQVNIHPAPLPKRLSHKQLNIVYQDEWLIVVRKEAGLPTVASGEEKDMTVLRLLSNHLKGFNARAKVYHVNRLDKDSVGYVVFALSKELQQELSTHWSSYVRKQLFALVLEGIPSDQEGMLQPPTLAKDAEDGRDSKKRPHRGRTGESNEEDRSAGRASWRILSTGESRALISAEILSGRNNRLRRQWLAQRLPIVGDWRNGSGEKGLERVALEMTYLSFVHPKTGQLLEFKEPIPALFRRLLKSPAQRGEVLRGKRISKNN